ncbi:hypothetical protein [Hymenobacter glacieicola]|uniref:DUF3137 domain-containing protein n=1 Tax=Hymenobacter glacieicola TaxID=1562124 RepID=A0ABQ1X355_9BACT|nr:hypothetical protein [Hymenobacter glacieicola]GGG51778.1 hypothetical protein GCM10011378_30000 [Hymenobacter glacieicola]
MSTSRIYSAPTETALWQQVAADLAQEENQYAYRAELRQGGYSVQFELDIDLGGGFEGGYELTTFRAVVAGRPDFHFALHEQDWVHEIGKLLGLTDVELDDPELDAAFIITTNDAGTLRALLTDSAVRATLLAYPELRLSLAPTSSEPGAEVVLSCTKEEGITDPAQLQEIYHMLYVLLLRLAPAPNGAVAASQ